MTAWAILGLALLHAMELPTGPTPEPVPLPHFPDRLHAFVWSNWPLVPVDRMAKVVGAEPAQISELAKSMGLPGQTPISDAVKQRAFITVIRRNWHLLPYDQLLQLLDWMPEQLAYTLREDDFLYIKLGSLKPKCEPLHYSVPEPAVARRAAEIAQVIHEEFPGGLGDGKDPLFGFIDRLSAPLPPSGEKPAANIFNPRFCSSYFAMYGDPLLDGAAESFPDGYLDQLSRTGVNGVWMQAVLYKLAEFPWDLSMSDRHEERLRNLARLVERAKKHGIGVYLYLNEPRAMPLSFFEKRPELKGVEESGFASMCTSVPEVRDYLRGGVASICREVPDLAGFFTISASENLTNCWSHFGGANCPRCAKEGGAAVIAGLHKALQEGINAGGGKARLIAWDWGWKDDWARPIVAALPKSVSLMSVSEWSIPITRGGVDSVIGEYSLSTPGPGPRATKNWAAAKEAGLNVLAKVQANVTWELAAVPYIPAVGLAARHALNLRGAGIDGMMLGWTLGGCPSPNLEVFAEMGHASAPGVDDALRIVAQRRFGDDLAPAAVDAWKTCSKAFAEYPYHGSTVYSGPQHMGPANPLWGAPTGYAATMVGFPYDGLDAWRAIYPVEVFIGQFGKMADGFDQAVTVLHEAVKDRKPDDPKARAFLEETGITEACAIHFRSVANQSAFVSARNALEKENAPEARGALLAKAGNALRSELALAKRLYVLQSADSRIGYEASNHYFYVPIDLAAKVINVRYLLDTWLPSLPGAPASLPASPAEQTPTAKQRAHGDYLTLGAGGQAASTEGGLQFARVSIWTGDPQTSLLADPGKTEQYAFYGVHGKFDAGTSFTVIAKDQDRTFSATAKRTIDMDFAPASTTIPITEIVFEGESCRQACHFLAIVGKKADYKPIHLTELTDSGKVSELSERASREVPDFKRLPYDYPNSGFLPDETKTRALSFSLPDGTASLVSWRTPCRPLDHPDLAENHCETALLLWDGVFLDCSSDCGQGIQFFTIDHRTYCWRDFGSCASGERYVEVFELTKAKGVSVYKNGDFAD